MSEEVIGRTRDVAATVEGLRARVGQVVRGVPGVGKTAFTAAVAAAVTGDGIFAVLLTGPRATDELVALAGLAPGATLPATPDELCRDIAAAHGARQLVVIVDDANLTHEQTGDWLCRAAESGALTLCLVSEMPPLDWTKRPAVCDRFSRMVRSTGGRIAELEPLSRDETIELARRRADGVRLDAFRLETIYRISGGAPAIVTALLTQWRRRPPRDRLADASDAETRELPSAAVVDLFRARMRDLSASALTGLAVLGKLDGLAFSRAKEAVRRAELLSIAAAKLVSTDPGTGLIQVNPVAADLALSTMSAEEERAAVVAAVDALMLAVPDGTRSPVESSFIANAWLRYGATGIVDRYGPRPVRRVITVAARALSRAGRARQASALLTMLPAADDDLWVIIERARAASSLHEHDAALELLNSAQRLVTTRNEGRAVLNAYQWQFIWHRMDLARFDAMIAQAAEWLPGDETWLRELDFADVSPQTARSKWLKDGAARWEFLIENIGYGSGDRASAASISAVMLAIDGDATAAERMFAIAQRDIAEIGRPRDSMRASYTTLVVCRALFTLLTSNSRSRVEHEVGALVESAARTVMPIVVELAVTKWVEALCALEFGDGPTAVRVLDSMASVSVPESLHLWLDLERVRALALTGEIDAARALEGQIAPLVHAASDSWASFELVRARIDLALGAGNRGLSIRLAERLAARLNGVAPLLAERVRRRSAQPAIQPVPSTGLSATGATARLTRAADYAREGRTAQPELRPVLSASALPDGASSRTAATASAVTPIRSSLTDLLSERELLVARLAAAGSTNAEIARELFLSVRTVESHLHHARVKLGVSGREGLRPYFELEAQRANGTEGF